MANWPQVSVDTEKEWSLCFVCGQKNPIGLKLHLAWDGKTASTEFTPDKLYQGWSGTVHGGILSCVLDETMNYAALFSGVNTVTAKMQTRFRNPAQVGKPLVVTARLTKKTKRLVEAQAEAQLKDGTPIADSTATMFILSQRKEWPSG